MKGARNVSGCLSAAQGTVSPLLCPFLAQGMEGAVGV